MNKEFARKIPDIVRSQKLLTADNPIDNAQVRQGNYQMMLLCAVYYEFLAPQEKQNIQCVSCLRRIKNIFVAMKGALMELEKEYQLLNFLKNEN